MGFASHFTAGDGRSGDTVILGGTFTTAGGSQPTEFGGDIISVTRQVTAGALIFFRCSVRPSNRIDMVSAECAFSFGIDVGTSEALVATASKASLTPNGGAVANNTTEFDVVVRDGAFAAIDTAAIKVHFTAVVRG